MDWTTLEFLFRHDDSYIGPDGRFGYHIIPHRVVKRTPKRIFVEREGYCVSSGQVPSQQPECRKKPMVSLDRQAFEREGVLRCRTLGTFGCIFTVNRDPLDEDAFLVYRGFLFEDTLPPSPPPSDPDSIR